MIAAEVASWKHHEETIFDCSTASATYGIEVAVDVWVIWKVSLGNRIFCPRASVCEHDSL